MRSLLWLLKCFAFVAPCCTAAFAPLSGSPGTPGGFECIVRDHGACPSQRPSTVSFSSGRHHQCSLILPRSASFRRRRRRNALRTLTTTSRGDDQEDDSRPSSDNHAWTGRDGPIRRAIRKFKARPGTYMLIPCVAAVVGWFTNWLAVQMIFYPIQFRGIPLRTWKEVPLGLLGWQGIVPCKTRPMSEAMVEMVTTQLISVKEVFGRLDPRQVADLLAPRVAVMMREIVREVLPVQWMVGLPGAIFNGLDAVSQGVVQVFNRQFLVQLTKSMQANIDEIFSLRNCVVDQMMQDRAKLGELFRMCGQKELDFLTNSGLWFGFLLGLLQMGVALFWENPWSLSIGGGIVGLATNWLALKWIFEPVDPTRIGPFLLQGKFLRRQPEVAREFSKFFANNILTSDKLWTSVLTDPQTSPAFAAMFSSHFTTFVKRVVGGFGFGLEPETLDLASRKALEKLPEHVPVLYGYMDKTLQLEKTLRERMEKMTSRQFERVLHPIFEEDELTLILAGAALGFAAGLVQQGLETGAIQIPNLWRPFRKEVTLFWGAPKARVRHYASASKRSLRASGRRIRHCFIGSPFWRRASSKNASPPNEGTDPDDMQD